MKPAVEEGDDDISSRKCMVYLLNGQEFQCTVPRSADGSHLLRQVRELLDIMEFDYFGLYFEDSAHHKYWLEGGKSIKKQLKSSPWKFHFSVKFYPSDPSQLVEDISRYYMVLQLRDNIVSGSLPCSFVTHALLGSFVVQSELGDYDAASMRANYVLGFQFAPNQNSELEEKVIELHKTHSGMTPEEAEIAFLENSKKLPLYGVDQHAVKDSENVDLKLGVSWNGLRVYRDQVQINRFAWPRILKISYARSKFYIRIRPVDQQTTESVVGFKLPNHRAAKKLWKACVEHHTFFRLTRPDMRKAKLIHAGSTFRYSGRTQHQTRQTIATASRKNVPKITRTASRRSYTGDRSKPGRNADGLTPPELPRKEHQAVTTETEVVTFTEEVVTEAPPKPSRKNVEETTVVTETTEVVEVVAVLKAEPEETNATEIVTTAVIQEVETAAPKSLTTSSSCSSLSSDSDSGMDRVTRHQRRIHKMKPKNKEKETNGKFLREPAPGSRGSSDWDLRLQSSPSKDVTPETKRREVEVKSSEAKTEQQASSVREVTVVTSVTTEVTETQNEDAPAEKQEDSIEKEEVQETKEVPLPDFVPVVEPKDRSESESSSSSSPSEDEEKEVDWNPPVHENIVHESTVVHTEYHVVDTVIQNPHVEEQEEPEAEVEPCEEVVAPVERKSSSSSSESSSDDEADEAPQEDEPETVVPPVEVESNENNNNNEIEVGPGADEAFILPQHTITTVETKSVRVEDVVIPRENNEVRKVALTADQDNNVTVTETRSSSSDSSSSSSSSDVEDDRDEYTEVSTTHVVNGFKPPIVETEIVVVEPTEEDKPEVTMEPPLVHTETKTITYESNKQSDPSPQIHDQEGVLLSSQTITAETMSSVTTTHITKTVVGSVSQTRVEKSIVITADGEANLHQAMAEAIKDTQESNPNINITKVVVHEEKVIEHP